VTAAPAAATSGMQGRSRSDKLSDALIAAHAVQKLGNLMQVAV
jgi:hypothetical protein